MFLRRPQVLVKGDDSVEDPVENQPVPGTAGSWVKRAASPQTPVRRTSDWTEWLQRVKTRGGRRG